MPANSSTGAAHAVHAAIAVLPSPDTRYSLVDQLMQWAEQRMAEQVFRAGMRMPSVRQLAEQRGVSRSTVVQAYERLVARGLLHAQPGSGFYVRSTNTRRERRPAQPEASQVIDISWLARNMLSGLPAELSPGFGSLPAALCGGDLLRDALRSMAAVPPNQLSRGTPAQGYLPLREQLVRRLAEIEVAATPAQVLTTSGCTQAISLVAQHFLKPGDAVLTGDPAWSAQLGALAMADLRVIGVPYTEHGPDLQAMAALAAQHKPRLLLMNSVLHNPTGTVLSLASAYQILRIAEQFDLHIVEDDIYTDFVPDKLAAPRLASLDQLQRVIYMSSFSKMLAPSARVGYIAARSDVVQALTVHKLLGAWSTPELMERLVLHVLTDGHYRRHCQRVRTRLDTLRDSAFQRFENMGLKAMGRPSAGFLGWFDTGVDTNTLAAAALEAGYLLAPGALFSPTQTPSSWMRLNICTSEDPGMLKWLGRALATARHPAR